MRLSKFSFRCASTAGRYGISPPSTSPNPPGVAPSAPIATTGEGRAPWPSRSQLASFNACQIPFRLGWCAALLGPSAHAVKHAPHSSVANKDFFIIPSILFRTNVLLFLPGRRCMLPLLGGQRVFRRRHRQPFVQELLHTITRQNFGGIQVALRIDADKVDSLEVARRGIAQSELVENASRFPPQHQNPRVAIVGHV